MTVEIFYIKTNIKCLLLILYTFSQLLVNTYIYICIRLENFFVYIYFTYRKKIKNFK